MTRPVAPPVADRRTVSRSSSMGFHSGAAIRRLLPLSFRCFPDPGAHETGAQAVSGSGRP
jgi:hypothetical protein